MNDQEVESELKQEEIEEQSQKPTRHFKTQFRKYWKYTKKWFPFAILIGVISGVLMALFTALVVNLFKWLSLIPIPLYIFYPIIGGITSIFLYFGFKEVKGAGLSYVLSHKNTTSPLHPRVLITKFFTSVLTLGIGAPAGREGPAVTLGSTASSVIGDKLGMTQQDEMHAITIGAAACTAAVFRAPLGGTVFAAEVPYKRDLDETVFLPALVASAISLLISDAILEQLNSVPAYLILSDIEFSLDFLSSLHFLLLGIIAGFLGIGFSLLFKTFVKWIEGRIKDYMLPIIGMAITAVIVFLIDDFFFPSSTSVKLTLSGTGFDSINVLLENYGTIAFSVLLVLLLGKILVTSTCVGFGNSAGIMGPTLVTGAAFGCLYAQMFGLSSNQAVVMMVVGMSAMHTATTKTPISSMILVLEMVGFPKLVLPIILANAMAFIISMDFSLYRGQIQSKEVILRRRIQYTDLLETLSVKETMQDKPPLVKADSLLEESFSLLYLHKTSALLVIDENEELAGIISSIDFQDGFAKGKLYVHEAMTKDVIVAYDDEKLNIVFDRLTDYRIESLPVVSRDNNKKILGLICFRDIESRYEAALTKLQSKRTFTIEEIENEELEDEF